MVEAVYLLEVDAVQRARLLVAAFDSAERCRREGREEVARQYDALVQAIRGAQMREEGRAA